MHLETVLHPLPRSAPRTDPVDVLVVCARGNDVQAVRDIVSAWPVPTRVHWTSDPVDALRLALSNPPSLVVVDARLDRAGGRALVGQIARWRAEVEVFVFTEPRLDPAPGAPSTWHWRELTTVLGWWAQRHLRPSDGGAPS